MDSAAKKETPASIPVPNAPSVIMVGSRRKYLAADNLKIDITVKLSSAMDVYQGFEVNDRAKFNVAIIYEDGAAGKRAKHFYDRVIRELVDECDFSLELWSFQVIAVPEIGNSAAKAAAQADLVILSMHRKAQLSTQTRDWIERWSGLVTDNKSALVALLDQPGMKRAKAASTLVYLRKVADRKEISFYTHTIFDLSTK